MSQPKTEAVVSFMKGLNKMTADELAVASDTITAIKADTTISDGPLGDLKADPSSVEAGLKLFQIFAAMYPRPTA